MGKLAVTLFTAALLCGCGKNGTNEDPAGPKAPDPAGPEVNADDPGEPASPDPALGEAVTPPAQPGDGSEMTLGKPMMLTAGKPYAVAGTGLVVTNQGAAMAMVSDDKGNDNEILDGKLEVRLGKESTILSLHDTKPATWNGFRFRLDYNGYGWSADVAVVVERTE